MGRIFPLKDKPSCFKKTIDLIERCFNYQKPNSFEIDFAPLIDKSNHANCFILVDENENVLAHVGVKECLINNHPVCMLGAIAVDENNRGKGLFQELFQFVMAEKRDECAFFILWSDQENLYRRYGFYLCGMQFELEQTTGEKKFKNGSFADIKANFSSFKNLYMTPERDWSLVEKISSAQIFANEEGYFVLGKGQDLTGIIHEYGCRGEISKFLESIRPYGKVWMGAPLIETETNFYQYMIAPADKKQFASFVKSYTNDLVSIREINVMKQEVFFDFLEETLVLEVEEFLRGIFGPGAFEEFGDLKPLYISGLDSI